VTLSRRSFLKSAGALGAILPARVEARSPATAGVLERFKSTERYDSAYHQQQHGFQ